MLPIVENKKDYITTYAEHKLKEDRNAYLFRLRLTVDEIKELIGRINA